MKPTGNIRESVAGHGILASADYDFLHSVLPVETWDEVGELASPVPPKAEYPVDWTLVSRWAASCPPLAGVMRDVQLFDALAPRVGWHYAWSRLPQHLFLLDVLEKLVDANGHAPSMVLEPGCFTGGLLHFLAAQWKDTPCVGFDVSPVALDVCSHYSDTLAPANRPTWLEADFCQIHKKDLPEQVNERVTGGLVIISNAIESLGKSFERYHYLEKWIPRSRLISYWVNQGATGLLCERHPDPPVLAHSIVERAEWDRPACTCEVMRTFTAPTTENMGSDTHLGDWYEADCCVIRFSPPREKLTKKPKNKR